MRDNTPKHESKAWQLAPLDVTQAHLKGTRRIIGKLWYCPCQAYSSFVLNDYKGNPVLFAKLMWRLFVANVQ